MHKIYLSILLLLVTLSCAGSLLAVQGNTIATQGNGRGAPPCSSCHGAGGEGMRSNGYPYLAGLPVEYIKRQLQAFQQGSRTNPIMQPIAASLSEQEISALAGYYSKLENRLLSTGIPQSSDNPRGARLAMDGKWESGVPGCFQCHGPGGRGVAPHFPPIIGQPYSYVKTQLNAWREGKRSNDPLGLMREVSTQLSSDEIEAVAQYLSAQDKQ